MEKVLSEEEKIKKAIEISQRRNNNYYKALNSQNENLEKNKKEFKLFKRMILKIIACLSIYIIFYLASNGKLLFSSEIIDKTSLILSYDVNFEEWYKSRKNIINEAIEKLKNQNKIEQGLNLQFEQRRYGYQR